MSNKLKEQFYYGMLRSMDKEYLERTIKSYYEELYPYDDIVLVEIFSKYDKPLGDDKVEITAYDEEDRQYVITEYINALCYSIAEKMSRDDMKSRK